MPKKGDDLEEMKRVTVKLKRTQLDFLKAVAHDRFDGNLSQAVRAACDRLMETVSTK